MDIVPFQDRDIVQLNEWLKAHSCPEISQIEIPRVGLLAVTGNQPIAMGFLRQGEGFCLLDGFITAPGASAKDRNAALVALTNSLTNKAKDLGHSKVLCFSKDKNILRRASQHGFHYLEYSMMGKVI